MYGQIINLGSEIQSTHEFVNSMWTFSTMHKQQRNKILHIIWGDWK